MFCQHQYHFSDRFSMRSCPERAYILAFFAPPPPLSDENPVMLHFFAYAEIIFAHILVFPACAIEVQHINENSPTIFFRLLFIFIIAQPPLPRPLKLNDVALSSHSIHSSGWTRCVKTPCLVFKRLNKLKVNVVIKTSISYQQRTRKQ